MTETLTEKSEAQALMPGGTVKLSGDRVVEVRELTFGEVLRVRSDAEAVAFFADFQRAASSRYEEILRVAMRHPEWWRRLVERATDLSADEIEALPARDGMTLALAVLTENASFFGLAAMAATNPADSPTPSPS